MTTLQRLAVAVLLVCAAVLPPDVEGQTRASYSDQNDWFSQDKRLHFGISAVGSAGVYALARQAGLGRWTAIAASSLVVGTAGILREIGKADRNDLLTRQHLSRKDLVWDGIGIVVGISVTDLLFWTRRNPEPRPRP